MRPLSIEELSGYATHFATEERLIAQGKGVAIQIQKQLSSFAGEPSSDWGTVVEALGDSVIRNLSQYRVGADLPLVAWTTRNIFELEMTLAFVTGSQENLASFVSDVVLDEIQVREAAALLSFDRKDPTVAQRQDEALDRLKKRKLGMGLMRNRPTSTREMACSLGRQPEYDAYNKVYSKLVHPTAYLLMGGRIERTDWDAYGLHVMSQGVSKAGKFLDGLLKSLIPDRGSQSARQPK